MFNTLFDRTQVLHIFSQILLGMLGAVIIQLIFTHHVPHIVTVDITGMVKNFESEALKQKLTTDELTQKTKKFGSALNLTMDAYPSDNNVILVPKEVVISGAVDKTDEIKAIVKKRMGA